MVLTDRLRRQLLDGVTFNPQEPVTPNQNHMFLDLDNQLRLGVGSDIGTIPNVINPDMGDVPTYNTATKRWEAVAASQTGVYSGSFQASDWAITGDIATLTIDHNLGSQNVSVALFDMTSGVAVETYAEQKNWSSSSTKLVICASAIFAGMFLVSVITSPGTAINPTGGGGAATVVSTIGNVSGTTPVQVESSHYIKATLIGDITISFNTLSSTAAERVVITLTQDSVGGHYVSWDPSIKWTNGYIPEGSLTPNSTDVYEFLWNGSYYTCFNYVANIL